MRSHKIYLIAVVSEAKSQFICSPLYCLLHNDSSPVHPVKCFLARIKMRSFLHRLLLLIPVSCWDPYQRSTGPTNKILDKHDLRVPKVCNNEVNRLLSRSSGYRNCYEASKNLFLPYSSINVGRKYLFRKYAMQLMLHEFTAYSNRKRRCRMSLYVVQFK